jgi:threonine/homoserine/homoserine lactone efflux protein
VPGYVWGFAAIAVPFVATPGASTAIVLRNSVAGGVRAGVATALGVNAGSIAYGLLTAFGVSVALERWPGVWTLLLRVGGAGYLAWLGARSLWRAAAGDAPDLRGAADPRATALRRSQAYTRDAREGFVTNALNPSIATFYLLVLPQCMPAGAPFAPAALVLTVVHVALALTWHLTWAAAGGTLAAVFARPRPRRLLEAATGLALLFLAWRFLEAPASSA